MERDIIAKGWRADCSTGPRLRIVWGDRSVPVRVLDAKGLSIDITAESRIPGLVHLYLGDEHVATGLICSDGIEGSLHRFHFKRISAPADRPPRDYAPGADLAPALPPTPDRARSGL